MSLVVQLLDALAQLLGEFAHCSARHPATGPWRRRVHRFADDELDAPRVHELGAARHGRGRAADADGHDRHLCPCCQIHRSVHERQHARAVLALALTEHHDRVVAVAQCIERSPQGRPIRCVAVHREAADRREQPGREPVLPHRVLAHHPHPVRDRGVDRRVDVAAMVGHPHARPLGQVLQPVDADAVPCPEHTPDGVFHDLVDDHVERPVAQIGPGSVGTAHRRPRGPEALGSGGSVANRYNAVMVPTASS